MIDIKELVLKKYTGSKFEFGDAPTNDDIKKSEKILGVIFPSEFKEFVTQTGWLKLGNNYFFGIPLDLIEKGNSISMTQFARTEWDLPEKYIVIYSSEDEVLWCMEENNNKVFAYDVNERNFVGTVANSFEEALVDYIKG